MVKGRQSVCEAPAFYNTIVAPFSMIQSVYNMYVRMLYYVGTVHLCLQIPICFDFKYMYSNNSIHK